MSLYSQDCVDHLVLMPPAKAPLPPLMLLERRRHKTQAQVNHEYWKTWKENYLALLLAHDLWSSDASTKTPAQGLAGLDYGAFLYKHVRGFGLMLTRGWGRYWYEEQ